MLHIIIGIILLFIFSHINLFRIKNNYSIYSLFILFILAYFFQRFSLHVLENLSDKKGQDLHLILKLRRHSESN